ncbi:MAG: GDSL-type esterase/lipase family protein [Mucilaginibacter sp.]|uniref:GDSL-type esterase/lipase family protein n=1 Tax=Mucilaginibacter sp. TaxID=1882438 RepID=UPI003265C44B
MKRTVFILLIVLCSSIAQAVAPIKVACIGNSITYGARIVDREHDSYPAQLQRMLGDNYVVSNFGVNSSTLLHKGNKPYINQPQYQQALQSNPDVVFIKLGTNDSKLVNRVYLDEYEHDYKEMIAAFEALPSHPRIVLLLPIKSFHPDSNSISDKVIVGQIIPHIQHLAYTEHLEVIDLHSLFADKESLLADKIHPNAEGAGIIAKRLADLLQQKRDVRFDIDKGIKYSVKQSSFYGYVCNDFTLNNHDCKVVQPKWSAIGHPWVWRARFWGHEPQADISLLERGFHIVYCDVIELFGNDEAINAWNGFYKVLRSAGLNKKAVMEGMSRGGVYVYNWAAVNPDKVACVYVDNAVLDLKSWPLGGGKSQKSVKDVEKFKADYHITTDEQLNNFHGSPIDKIGQIVKGKYPMLHLLADNDEAVAPADNTLLFEQKVKALGGNITVLHKPGAKHHPHSLPNPMPIVDFILKTVQL